jgi:hypothetical protein
VDHGDDRGRTITAIAAVHERTTSADLTTASEH